MRVDVKGMTEEEKRKALYLAGCTPEAVEQIIRTTYGWSCVTISDK